MKIFTQSILAAMLIWASGLMMLSCNKNVKRAGVNPPFEKVRIAYTEHEIVPAQGKEIKLPNGTVITVPENAFKDADGNLVTETVTLKYREFHTPAEIIASGIPMLYDSAGETHCFESAGMFDINAATKADKPVFIADDRNITVKMGSFRSGDDFNFYRFEEGENNWNYLGIKPAEPNVEKQQKTATLGTTPAKPIKPQTANKNAAVFDLKVNYTKFPELKEFASVMWQYAGTDAASNPEKNKWLFDKNWESVTLKPENADEGIYKLKLKTSGRDFETLVRPVLRGENYNKAMADFKKKADVYNARMDEALKLRRQADLLRTFQLKNFGMYNWDRIYKQPYVVPVAANFKYDDNYSTKINAIYLISGNERTVMPFDPQYNNTIYFDPNTRNCLLAILPGDKIAVFGANDFKALDIQKIKSNGDYTFNMKTLDKVIETPEDLDEILKNI